MIKRVLIAFLVCFAMLGTFIACGSKGEHGAQGAQGEQGEQGKSAYQLYCEKYGYDGTEEEWLNALLNGELVEPVTHAVTIDPANGESKLVQEVEHGGKVSYPGEPERMGYEFLGWYYDDGVYSEKWSFAGFSVTSDITLTAKWDYVTYELPIVNINTDGASIKSKINYTDMTFSIENCEGELADIEGGIRLRGNSTMAYDKKPYRIKFDKKQSLFGLDKAKSWVLLAEYLDPSAMSNYTAFSLASELDGLGFTPTPYKVNVYLNGDYVGLYTLCEQIQENEGRIGIELDEITEDMVDLKDFNFYICMDKSVVNDKDAVLDETYFYIEEYDLYYELKYPERDEFVSDEQFASFMSQLKEYTKEMLDAFAQQDLEKVKAEVNLDSLIDFLIVDIIMGERDHVWKSFNMYYTCTSSDPDENRRLNFGPVWDYDSSLNRSWTESPNQNYEINSSVVYSNVYYKLIHRSAELYNMLKERYSFYAKDALGEYIESLDLLYAGMEESIELNNQLWYSSIDEELSEKNIDFLKRYLVARKAQLDELWSLD